MGVTWAETSAKHGVARSDVLALIANSPYVNDNYMIGVHGGVVQLYIGPRHPQALPGDEIEVLIEILGERSIVIFHVQPLSSKFSAYRLAHPQYKT